MGREGVFLRRWKINKKSAYMYNIIICCVTYLRNFYHFVNFVL